MFVTFQHMVPDDVDQIARIEQQSSSPWTKALICSELSKENSHQYILIDQVSKKVVAWCAVITVAGETDLLKIAVDKDCRRSGYGSKILYSLVDELRKNRVEKIFLEVRSKNNPACALYRKHNFKEINQRKNYYNNPQDDALIFMKSILY